MMQRVKIGFIPSHRVPFSSDWAVKMRGRCLAEMKKVPGLDVIVPDESLTEGGVVSNLRDARETLDLFKQHEVAGVIVGGMTFGHETSAVGVTIAGMPPGTPVLHFATKGEVRENGLRPSDSWCGQFMITSALKRRHILFDHIPTCFPEEPVFGEWVSRFTRACAATQRFRGARIGQLGARPEEFESVWWDEASLQGDFNQTVVPVDLSDIFERLDAVSADEADVKAAMQEIVVGAEIPQQAQDSVATLARMEIAIKRLAEEKELDAMAVNCWEQVQRRYGICVCSVLGRLTDQGHLCACEVDVYGACSMLAAHAAGLGETPPHFIDWTELHPTEENVWLAWHCGNAPPSLCAESCSACLNQHMIIPVQPSWGTREFTLKPGPVTCCRLVEYDGWFTMFIGNGEMVDMPPHTRGSYGWVKVNDAMDWEQKMVEHGIIHHGVLIHDPAVADALASFCKFNGIEVVRGA
jgi:L-fucose isomerase-like protein